jgi:hypothetical protein
MDCSGSPWTTLLQLTDLQALSRTAPEDLDYLWNGRGETGDFARTCARYERVVIAYLMSEWDSENQCVWYFINFIIDCTLGVLFAFLLPQSSHSSST